MIKNDFEFFKKNQSNLFKKYGDSYLVIKDEQILFSGKNIEECMDFANDNKLELETFIIQKCGKDENAYVQTFTSIVFA
jgi:hypothetical protein